MNMAKVLYYMLVLDGYWNVLLGVYYYYIVRMALYAK